MPARFATSNRTNLSTALVAVAAAGAFLAVSTAPASAADLGSHRYARAITVKRVAIVTDCRPVPTIVAPGRPGMGQPGTYLAIWDYRVPRVCQVNPYR